MSVWTTAHLVGTGTFKDPQNARVIYLAAGGLVLLAVLLGVGTWWWWRNAKVEHPALAPLEVMGTRGWVKSDHPDQQRRLESVRPAVLAAVDDEPLVPPEPVDLDLVLTRDDPAHFDDLVDPAVAVAAAAAVDAEPVVLPADAEPVVVPAGPEESVASTDVAVVAAATDAEDAPVEAVVEPESEVVVEPEVGSEPEPEPKVDVEPATEAEPEPAAAELGVASEPEATVLDADPEVAPVLAASAVAVLDPVDPEPAAVEPVAPQPVVAAEPAPKPIVVIDTAPSSPSSAVPSPAATVEPQVVELDDHADDTPQHIDPLLRSQAE